MDVYNIQSIQSHVADLSLKSTPPYMVEKESSHSHEEKDTLLVNISPRIQSFKHMVYG
jgi:hypothetical protein